MKTILMSVATVLAVLLLITGSAAAVSYTDDLGRTVELPEVVSHVIPSGEIAQILLLSFNPSYLASLNSTYNANALKYLPSSLANLSKTGSLFGAKQTMSDEQILAMTKSAKVDLILDAGDNKSGMAETMDRLQNTTAVPFVFISQVSIDDIPSSYQKLGKLLGEEERGEELSTYTQSIINRFNEGMAKVGDNKKTMIYVTSVDGNSVHLIGSGSKSSYQTSLIDRVATNIAPTATSGGGLGDEFTMEDIIQLNPDYIIVKASSGTSHDYYNAIISSPQWATLPAVQKGNVYEAPSDSPICWVNPPSSITKTLSMIWLGKLLYPEIFTYDMKTEIQKFYKIMFNYDMSDEEYATLTKYAVNKVKPQTTTSPLSILGILTGLAVTGIVVIRKQR